MRRTALVIFCLSLLGTLGVVFTRVVAARVPEQRASLEQLIEDRTGLAVRFEDVHLAWGLDGTSAVFTRVELTDPKAGRVRVVAPELRVEFDTWDFLRHRQFSLGHVTLASPDIEIIGEPESLIARASTPARKSKVARAAESDEVALVRRFTAWAELMPNGRIEVEGARVHLLRRGPGNGAARHSFTLSEAIFSRSPSSFTAYGTMLLAQDVGQSLFVSATLENLGPNSRVTGDVRVIARRVFLDKLSLPGLRGRGTFDAKLQLRDGRIDSGSATANVREFGIDDQLGARFDHVTASGKLTRAHDDLLVDVTDLQLTRGARLERAPKLSARLTLAPGALRIEHTSARADRMPFMAAELVAGLFRLQLAAALPEGSSGWTSAAGEFRDLRFDSGDLRKAPADWTLSARVAGAALSRDADHASLSQIAAHMRLDPHSLTLNFDPAVTAGIALNRLDEPRAIVLGGRVVVATGAGAAALRFEEFSLRSGAGSVSATGAWDGNARAQPLTLVVSNFDRALLRDAWKLHDSTLSEPAVLAEIAQGNIVAGTLTLRSQRDVNGGLAVDWARSRGKLDLEALATTGTESARLAEGRGTLAFARGAAQLRLASGLIDDLTLTGARIDWPQNGEPRLRASLHGQLSSPLLRSVLTAQGLDRLTGTIALDADARGERELRAPDAWRVTARVSDASVPLAAGLPPLEKLSGTLRYADAQLRSLALAGTWLGGPVEIESRRALRGQLSVGVSGVADAAPLLRLLGQDEVAQRVGGQLAWNGSALRATGGDMWQLALNSNLVGVESHLPAPFDKLKTRSLPMSAQLRVDARGIRDFEIDGGRELAIHGEVHDGVTTAKFAVQGVEGTLRRGADPDVSPEIYMDRLEMKRAPAVLAMAGALLPADVGLALSVGDLRQAERSLGALQATVTRSASGLEFSFESPADAPNRLAARGTCATADGQCRAEFSADTTDLTALLNGAQLPAEWPAHRLHAAGELSWPLDASAGFARSLTGRFDLETQGADSNHQLVANATLADGQIDLANVQGTGPEPTDVFRGAGRVGLLARDYDLTVDYEQVSIAATAVPTPARARLARAWNALRGSVARRGWTEAPESRRVQWHGSWDPVP